MSEQTQHAKSAFTMNDPGPDLESWVDGHHRVEPPSDKAGDTPIHVYAQAAGGAPAYGESATPWAGKYDIQVPLTWGALQVHASIDSETGRISAELGAALPLRPTLRLGQAQGDFGEGAPFRFEGPVSGQATLYVANNWLRMSVNGAAMGERVSFDIKLFPLV
jgi:hypothetical protein